MAAITQWLVLRGFAAAEIDGAGFFCDEFYRGEFSVLMRAITKWLRFAFTTGAPVISFTLFYVDCEWSI